MYSGLKAKHLASQYVNPEFSLPFNIHPGWSPCKAGVIGAAQSDWITLGFT